MIKKIIMIAMTFLLSLMAINVYGSELNIKDTFPDVELQGCIKSSINGSLDGYLNDEEIKNASSLNVFSDKIISLKGLSKLYNLKELYIIAPNIIDLDEVEKLKNLEKVDIGLSEIKEINLNIKTKKIGVFCKNLSSINISKMSNINICEIEAPKLTSVAQMNGTIDKLYIHKIGNTKTTLDKFDGVNKLFIDLPKINKDFHIDGMKNVESINAFCCSSKNAVIKNCNKLKSIDLTKYDSDRISNYHGFKAKRLDIKNCNSLKNIKLNGIKVKKIYIENNKKLERISAIYNKKYVKTLKISKVSRLKDIQVKKVNLKNIDLSKYHKLKKVSIRYCNMSKVKMSRNNKITYLNMECNKLRKINTKYLTNIKVLKLTGNKLKKINTSRMKRCMYLYLEWNNIKKIDLTKMKKLYEVELQGNKLIGTLKLPRFKNNWEINVAGNRLNKIISEPRSSFYTIICNDNRLKILDLKDGFPKGIFCKNNPGMKIYCKAAERIKKDKSAKIYYKS